MFKVEATPSITLFEPPYYPVNVCITLGTHKFNSNVIFLDDRQFGKYDFRSLNPLMKILPNWLRSQIKEAIRSSVYSTWNN